MDTDDIKIDIDINLIRKQLLSLRGSKHLSQKELSERSGLSVSTISLLENSDNSPSLRSIIKYLDALGGHLYISNIRE